MSRKQKSWFDISPWHVNFVFSNSLGSCLFFKYSKDSVCAGEAQLVAFLCKLFVYWLIQLTVVHVMQVNWMNVGSWFSAKICFVSLYSFVASSGCCPSPLKNKYPVKCGWEASLFFFLNPHAGIGDIIYLSATPWISRSGRRLWRKTAQCPVEGGDWDEMTGRSFVRGFRTRCITAAV